MSFSSTITVSLSAKSGSIATVESPSGTSILRLERTSDTFYLSLYNEEVIKVEVARYEFQDLRDLLYTAITASQLHISSIFRIGDTYVKIWLRDSDLIEILECKTDFEASFIEFEIETGKYKAVRSIKASPNKHYFIVLKPKRINLPGGITYDVERRN